MQNKRKKGLSVYWINTGTIVMLATLVFLKNLGNLDEIWLYSYAKNMANGLIPYRDINICVTPFSFWIEAIVLRLLGQSLWISRCLAIGLYGTLYMMGSRLLFKRGDGGCFIQLLFSAYYLFMYNILFYEYNALNCLFVIGLIALEEKIEEKTVINSFLQGILIALILLTKQSTGLVAMISYLTVFVINKKNLKAAAWWLAGLVSIISMFGLYLLHYEIWEEFIEFTVKGISTFTINMQMETIVITLISQPQLLFIFIYLILIAVRIVCEAFKGKEPDAEHKKLRAYFCYWMISVSVCYPLFDPTHVSIGLLPVVPFALLDLEKLLEQKNYKPFLIYYTAIIFLIWNVILLPKVLYGNAQWSSLPEYEGILITSQMEQMVEDTIDTILRYENVGYEVYVLDASATIFFVSLDQYHKYYDIFLQGNLGEKTILQLVSNICKPNNVILYRKDEAQLNYQFPKGVKEILLECGMEVQDSCEMFDVYMY